MKTNSKLNKVLMYLKENGSITSWEAIDKFGATRLSAIIFDLRHKYNLNIVTYDMDFTDRYGYKSNYAKYVLQDEGE